MKHYTIIFHNEYMEPLFQVSLSGNAAQRRKTVRAFKHSPFHKGLYPIVNVEYL